MLKIYRLKFLVAICSLVILLPESFAAKKIISKTKSPAKSFKTKKNKPEKVTNLNFENGLKVHSLGIGLGQTFLNGHFDDNGLSGVTADLYYNYSASHSFDLNINAHYSKHERGQLKTYIAGLALGIKGKFYHFDSFFPFAIAGLGFYIPSITKQTSNSLTETDSNVTFGAHFGAGSELKLNNRFTIGLVMHYHNPFDTEQTLGSELVEVKGSYYKLLITTLYSF